jgi:hypothetical protein
LGQEFIPQVQREMFVNAAEAGDEMVLERANGTFGGVAPMY